MQESDPLDEFIAHSAQVNGLPLRPEWMPGIRENLAMNLRLGALVAEFPLPDEAEPAPVFKA